MKDELERLETTERKKIADELHESVSQGDISESFDYEEAKRQQGFIEGKIIELKSKIRRAKVVKKDKANSKVQIGSTMKLLFDGEEETFYMTGASEADPLENKISYASSLGKSLMDKSEGATIGFEAPKGTIKVKILEVN